MTVMEEDDSEIFPEVYPSFKSLQETRFRLLQLRHLDVEALAGPGRPCLTRH
jgi:hypothetical protein